MSRKPTIVSLSKDTASSSPKQRTSGTNTAQKSKQTDKLDNKPEKPRKPQAMKAPKVADEIDVFDTSSDTDVGSIPNHIPEAGKRSKWGIVLLASITTLITLGLGLWFTQIIEDLFKRHELLGWIASAILSLAIISLLIICIREIFALWRLRKLAKLREDVSRTIADRSISSGKVLSQIVGLYDERKEMSWHISQLATHHDDVMDDRDRLLLAERYLMKPLDQEAKQIIAGAAKRVSVVTAVNPAASLDVIFTGYQILRMLRQLTALYGNRPGSIGTMKLAGMVGSHLAVTSGLALSDAFIQQFIGKGLAGRLSAKLGEGTVNGIMTARIGIAALDLCRPMPFQALERPGLREFITTLASSFGGETKPEAT